MSFLSIEFGAGGASKTKVELGTSGTCKNTLRAQRNAEPDTSSVAPEAPAKTLKKSRNQTLSARVSFLSIEFGAGGASKTKVEHGTSGTCKNQLRAQRNAGPDTSSLTPEAPAKALRK